jgi:CheY-like chemotaxis protein
MEIVVRDTGHGISADVMRRIFDPFFSTKEVGHGFGLGLAAVYRIISNHYGSIEVSSELNRGTIFTLYLPIDKNVKVTPSLEKEHIKKGSGCILIVDDESIIRNTLEPFLIEIGYTVLLAKDGLEGTDIYREKHTAVDLIILDMIMPRMNGETAFTEMRKIDPAIKIILSSGFSRGTSIKELLDQGNVRFLQKPYTFADLSRILFETLHPPTGL